MINPVTGLDVPVALGGALESSSGRDASRAESVTRDDGVSVSAVAAREAPPVSVPEPKGADITPAVAPPAAVDNDEVEVLHLRFDRMEALLKRKLAVATLHARFDHLEAWLNARFPN